jgi:hypothetical protein
MPTKPENVTTDPRLLKKQAKALYEDVDYEGFKDKQQNIKEYEDGIDGQKSAMGLPAPSVVHAAGSEPEAESARVDRIGTGTYGSRGAERRIYTDPQGNEVNVLTPEGIGARGPQRPVPAALYDKGGALPRINLNDPEDDHVLIIAERGERVLTPQQNKEYERTHPGARKRPMRAEIADCGGTVYDDGGEVAMPDARAARVTEMSYAAHSTDPSVGTFGQKAINKLEGIGRRVATHLADASLEDAAAPVPVQETPLMNQLYDEGGRVGAPVDFPGRVFPQPKSGPVIVQSSEEPDRSRVERLSGGAKMNALPYYEGDYGMDTSRPSASQIIPRETKRMPKITVFDEGGTVDERDLPLISDERQRQTQQAQPAQASDAEQKLIDDARAQNTERKASALDKKDSVSLGHSLIADRVIDDHEDRHQARQEGTEGGGATKSAGMPKIETPRSSGATDYPNARQTQQGDAAEQMKRLGGPDTGYLPAISPDHRAATALSGVPAEASFATGLPVIGGERKAAGEEALIPTEKPTAPTAQENLINQRAELKNKMINGQTEQERFQAEKDLAELNRRSPWGSEGNRPGLLGKVGHIASRIGQAALLPTAPYLLPTIPGTQAQLAAQEARGEQGVEQAQKKEQQAAVTKEAEQQPALREEVQQVRSQQLTLAQEKVDNAARQFGWKKNPITGNYDVPMKYEEMTPQQQVAYDQKENLSTLQEAKAHEQEAKAALDRYKADPNSAQNQAALKRLQLEGQRVALAGANLGLHQKQFLADYYGVDEKGNAIPGAQMTPEGTPIGPKMGKDAGGKVFDKYSTQIDKAAQPFVAAYQRSGLLVKNLDLKSKQADALVAPELLSIAAGGAGSGLRMNEAEIKRVIGGRSAWDALVATANKIRESGGTFDDTQRKQLREIASYINTRNSAEVRVFHQGREAMLAAQNDAGKVREIYERMQETSADIAGKGLVAPGQKVKVGDYVIHGNDVVKVTSVQGGKTQGEVVKF